MKVVLAVHLVASLVFGVMWWVKMKDVQGASGVASYILNVDMALLAYIAVSNIQP